LPFIASRKAVIGSIPSVNAIPHAIAPEANGTLASVSYGYGIPLTQTEGKGNGRQSLAISSEVRDKIASEWSIEEVAYNSGGSPVNVMVVDPLRIPAADFEMKLCFENQSLFSDSAYWSLSNLTSGDTYTSKHAIQSAFEEIIAEWGISVQWQQPPTPSDETEHFIAPLTSALEFANPAQQWLTGVPDDDSNTAFNWIRSGTSYIDPSEAGDPLGIIYNDLSIFIRIVNQ
jgi:hypothetical protein